MRLTPGEAAPDFSTTTLQGEPFELSRKRGKPVWLAFFRFASCPLCNLRVHQIVGDWPRFERRDVTVLGVFQSPAAKLQEYVAKHNPPFTLVADPEMDLYRLYGVEAGVKGLFSAEVAKAAVGAARTGLPMIRPWQGPATRIPADFLIDRQGKVHTAFYGSNIAEHIPFETVERFLDEMRA